jgi:hypothetical protein
MARMLSVMALYMKENSMIATNSMATECFTIPAENYAIQEVGKIILFMVSECFTINQSQK